jgi:hypothetical protein
MSKPNTAVPKPNDEPEIVRTARKFDVSVETMHLARALGRVILADKQCGMSEIIDALRIVLTYHVEVAKMMRGSRTTWH